MYLKTRPLRQGGRSGRSSLKGTKIYLNADNDPAVTEVRATQRSLGYREVDYKAAFSSILTWSALAPANITTAAGITTYDYSGQSNITTNLVGFWTSKDLGQLLYSSEIEGIDARDRMRFWRAYLGAGRSTLRGRWLRRFVLMRGERYRKHNAKAAAKKAAAR